jgi:hypothetical protein
MKARPPATLKRRATTAMNALTMCVVAIAFAGCTSGGEGTRSSPAASPDSAAHGRDALRPVSLPDLSKLAPSVQKQLNDAYATLTENIQRHDLSDRDLGTAYGEMGKLLFAAEYRDAAEPCLLNAQALDPREFRWP